jgi:hypothetical protein
MEESSYYREQALRARRLAKAITDQYAKINLERLATDYSAIAEDSNAAQERFAAPNCFRRTRTIDDSRGALERASQATRTNDCLIATGSATNSPLLDNGFLATVERNLA